jgi:putative hydrolase of the HAD superfamily
MEANSRCIDAVIFDLDDTLLDWSGQAVAWDEFNRPLAGNIYSHLLASGQSLPPLSDFADIMQQNVRGVWEDAKVDFSGAHFGDAVARTLREVGVDPAQFDIDELLRAFDWRPMPGVTPYQDTHDVLDALRNRGYKIGLITNSFFPMWMRDIELRHYDLIDYFDARITSGDTGYMKPHPAIYERMLALLDVPAERALFVGDRPAHDIAGANEVGLVSVLIDPPHLDRDGEGVQPDYTVTALSELLPILETLESCSEQPA